MKTLYMTESGMLFKAIEGYSFKINALESQYEIVWKYGAIIYGTREGFERALEELQLTEYCTLDVCNAQRLIKYYN